MQIPADIKQKMREADLEDRIDVDGRVEFSGDLLAVKEARFRQQGELVFLNLNSDYIVLLANKIVIERGNRPGSISLEGGAGSHGRTAKNGMKGSGNGKPGDPGEDGYSGEDGSTPPNLIIYCESIELDGLTPLDLPLSVEALGGNGGGASNGGDGGDGSAGRNYDKGAEGGFPKLPIELDDDEQKIICVHPSSPPQPGGIGGKGGEPAQGGKGATGGTIIVAAPNQLLKKIKDNEIVSFSFSQLGGANGKNGNPGNRGNGGAGGKGGYIVAECQGGGITQYENAPEGKDGERPKPLQPLVFDSSEGGLFFEILNI